VGGAIAMAAISDAKCLEFIEAIATEKHRAFDYDPSESKISSEILNLDQAHQASMVIEMKRWYAKSENHFRYHPMYSFRPGCNVGGCRSVLHVITYLLKRPLPFSEEQTIELLGVLDGEFDYSLWSMSQLCKVVENYLKSNAMTPDLQAVIERTAHRLQQCDLSERKYGVRLESLLPADKTIKVRILAGEVWADIAIQDLQTIEQYPIWDALLMECVVASGGKPSSKWLKLTRDHRNTIGIEIFKASVLRWFPLVEQPRTQPLSRFYAGNEYSIDVKNADILKGLVWLCADLDDREIARALGQLAISAYRKLPGIGPRCVKLGNACVWALGQMPGEFGIAQLARLKVKVKFGSAQQGIEKALTEAATRTGITRADIEELTVPTYGLTDIGIRREILGDFTVELAITGTHNTEIRWFKPDGTPQKSIPQAVKTHHPEALKALKQVAKDIQSMLPAQRDRLESLYLTPKTWDYATWKPRYLDHPLIATIARRLIWQFESGKHHALGIWLDGQLVDVTHQPIDWLDDQTQVQLWHPIAATSETILAWRNWLLQNQIAQPFKQAHREIYLLTAAEQNTGTYSNRFAAHVIKQHQFHALCGQRGWKNALRLMVDDSFRAPTLRLPHWGLRAEFWIEGIGDNYGTDTNDTGTFLYLATDQVRFYPLESAENYAHAGGGNYAQYNMDSAEAAIPLEDIPALGLTEVMRDVDLFVGVASVGNDPNWSDGGPEGRHYDYWQSYSFGELSATAKTRRQLLATLVPKLKIADRCTFQEKFLVVQGDIRTYKIHLGSGNILMEPNDQYLCIVPGQDQKGPSQVFLPFEGDRTLAIILSKAFLLADDKKIADPTIVAQIQVRA
jgi:Domain of unknown function (DUF4132)